MDPLTPRSAKRLNFLVDVAYIAVIGLLTYLCLHYVLSWVFPFLLAFAIVSMARPLVLFIQRKLKIKQAVVSIAVMLTIYALVGVLLFLLVVQLISLTQRLFLVLPDYYKNTISPALTAAGNNISALFSQLPMEWQTRFIGFQDSLMDAIQNLLISISQKGISWLSGFTTSLPAFFVAFVFTIMLTFFVGIHYEKVIAFFQFQLPRRAKRVLNDLRLIIRDTVFRYIKACAKLMCITFVELSVGLLVLRTENAIPIAAGIAVFDALPVFGTGAIMIPWILIELVQGNFTYTLGLAILYAIVTVIRNIIEPKIVGDKLGLNPMVSVLSIYVGFRLLGVVGMIIMPMVTQVILELHRKGSVTLMRRSSPPPERDEPTPK